MMVFKGSERAQILCYGKIKFCSAAEVKCMFCCFINHSNDLQCEHIKYPLPSIYIQGTVTYIMILFLLIQL